MTRNLIPKLTGPLLAVAITGGMILAALTAVVATPDLPAAGAQTGPAACRSMTDSITRLYHAYFDRAPDPAGFEHWVSMYQQGLMNLEDISILFEESTEFTRGHHGTTNQEFVDWVYSNVEGDEVGPGRQAHWVRSLDAGQSRASMMLVFSESEPFAYRTVTVRPMAGYGRFYPRGVHWYCGTGRATRRITPLLGAVWADYFVENRSRADDEVELWTQEPVGRRHLQMLATRLQPGSSDYNPDGEFTGDGSYGTHLEVRAGPETEWTVVFYPRSIGPARQGWQLTP